MTRTVMDSSVRVHATYSYVGLASRSAQYTAIGGNVVVGGSFAYSGFAYVSAPRTRVTIDPNIRVRGNDTYAGFEDVNGPLTVGETVDVHEAESGLTGQGRITEIDAERQLVYLSVDWSSLTEEEQGPQREPSSSVGGMLYLSDQSASQDDWMSRVATPSLAYVGFSNTTLWVNAPATSWSNETMSLGYQSPYLEVSSHLEILQPYAALRDDRVVA
jgi:hypothetical protein